MKRKKKEKRESTSKFPEFRPPILRHDIKVKLSFRMGIDSIPLPYNQPNRAHSVSRSGLG